MAKRTATTKRVVKLAATIPDGAAPAPVALEGDELIRALAVSIECLCTNLGQQGVAMTQAITALAEQVQLLRNRLERIDKRLDTAELVAADLWGYPVTQLLLPHAERLREHIENGRPRLDDRS